MHLTLTEIKDILAYGDLHKIIATLKQAEKSADKKIAELFYENKLNGEPPKEFLFIKPYPQRVILLSDSMQTPTLDNLWNYHKHFYDQLSDTQKSEFSFEDLAGIYEHNGKSRLFAICTKYSQTDGIILLPQGNYLCADCTEENREQVIQKLLETAQQEYAASPQFTIQLIVLSGILQWNYQAQIWIS